MERDKVIILNRERWEKLDFDITKWCNVCVCERERDNDTLIYEFRDKEEDDVTLG